jgi:hypothetical protein
VGIGTGGAIAPHGPSGTAVDLVAAKTIKSGFDERVPARHSGSTTEVK